MPDPDLEIRGVGGGGGGGGAGLQKNSFRPFGPNFGLKIRGGGAAPGPSPVSATDQLSSREMVMMMTMILTSDP